MMTYHAPIEELSQKAVDMLINLMEDKECATEIVIKGNVKERESVIKLSSD